VADYGASRRCWKKLSNSAVGVKKKLRRLSVFCLHVRFDGGIETSQRATAAALKFCIASFPSYLGMFWTWADVVWSYPTKAPSKQFSASRLLASIPVLM
jgi:hypothetical protein